MKTILILSVLLLAGCATKPVKIEFPVSPMMATSYAHGETSISWKADAAQTYTVYFTDAPYGNVPDWKPLPQANSLQGTGQQITIRDQVSPDIPRRYMLLTGDQKPL
jgi:hypothetical protein